MLKSASKPVTWCGRHLYNIPFSFTFYLNGIQLLVLFQFFLISTFHSNLTPPWSISIFYVKDQRFDVSFFLFPLNWGKSNVCNVGIILYNLHILHLLHSYSESLVPKDTRLLPSVHFPWTLAVGLRLSYDRGFPGLKGEPSSGVSEESLVQADCLCGFSSTEFKPSEYRSFIHSMFGGLNQDKIMAETE